MSIKRQLADPYSLLHWAHVYSAHDSNSLDPAAARRRIEETLRSNAARPLFTGTAVSDLSLRKAIPTDTLAVRCAGSITSRIYIRV